MELVWNNIKKFCTNLSKHNVSEYTAQCAYYTILSFIPFVMLIVTLIQYSSISKETLFDILHTVIPDTMSETTIGIIQEVYSKSVGTVSISAIFLLWSAKRGFHALSKGLHKIYETEKEYNFLFMQIKSIILTVFFVLMVISVLLLSVFGNTLTTFIEENFVIPRFITNLLNLSKIGVYIVLFIILLAIYRFVPGHKQGIKRQIPGAFIATVGWQIISYIFSIYLKTFKGFSVMYGSLTTIVLAMMWIYFCMYIILIGAEVNNFKLERLEKATKM